MVNNSWHVALMGAIVLFAGAVFLLDLLLPSGYEVWVLYLPVILAPVWCNSTRQVLAAACACSVLVVAASFLSPFGLPPASDVLNRGMGLLAIALTAFAGRTITRRSRQLADAVDGLRQEAVAHAQARQALEQSEERTRLAMDGAGMGIWDTNLRTRASVWSASHFRMLGYPPRAGGEASEEMWAAHVHPEDWARIQEAKEQARRERSLYACEYRVLKSDSGEVAWLAVYGRFHYDEAGEAVRFTGVSFDVTHRKWLEREVLEAAAREQRRIGQELHDIVGQELTGVGLMATALLQRLPESSPDRGIAGRLVAELDRLQQQVRALSRGLVPVQVEPHGLRAALEDLAARTSEQSGVAVTSECSARGGVADPTIATELFRIAREAVSNALRHGRPRRVWLRLFFGAEGLRLIIEDDGRGIDRTAGGSEGTGLRIMRYRAERIGARLEVGPGREGGTVVSCTLAGRWEDGTDKQ